MSKARILICIICVLFLLCSVTLWMVTSSNQKQGSGALTLPRVNDSSVNNVAFQSAAGDRIILDSKTATSTFTTSQWLHEALKNAEPGNVIQLVEGVYAGQFTLNQHNVTIQGQGPRTIIQLGVGGTADQNSVAINVFGHNCTVHGLKIISVKKETTGIQFFGSRSSTFDVEFKGLDTAIRVHTSYSKFSNVTIRNGRIGFHISSNSNTMEHIHTNNLTGWIASFVGDSNTLSSVTCDNCTHGVYIHGDGNSILHLEMRDAESPSPYWGIYIDAGTGNLVDSFQGQWDGLYLYPSSMKAVIRNVRCKKVAVSGTGHYLLNVDAGKLLVVSGSGHRIEKSTATELRNTGIDVELVQSAFNKTGRI